MKHFSITKTAQGFHIEGFPDAVKVLRITGPKSRRLADLALHEADLDFALECLTAINQVPEEPDVLRQALWRSAIVHFIKCFGQSESRFSLDPQTVYKGDTGAFEPYEYTGRGGRRQPHEVGTARHDALARLQPLQDFYPIALAQTQPQGTALEALSLGFHIGHFLPVVIDDRRERTTGARSESRSCSTPGARISVSICMCTM